jgi:VWFA-related protein
MNPLRRTATFARRSLVLELDGIGRARERRQGESMRASRFAFALFFVCAVAAAQVQESITVSYVEVPVTVVDRGGNAVRGLTKANFEITDEGKARPISGFEVADFASLVDDSKAPAAAPSVPAISPAARRNFLLVFDLSYSSPAAMTRAKDAARKFVSAMVAQQDRIGVATVDVAHGFRLLTSFTTDRSLVDAAVANPANFRAFDPLQLAGADMQKEVEQTLLDPGGKGRGGDLIEVIEEQRRQDDAYNRSALDRQVNLLGGLMKTLRSVRGQKHIVLLSEGFDPRLVQGRDAGLDQRKEDESQAVERGQIWRVDNDNRFGSSGSMSLVERMADVAKRCDVILDAVDIAGIRTNVDPREGMKKRSNEGLHLLAGVTGGTVFKNSNDLAGDLRRFMKTQEVVYVLAFQAPASQAGKFHHIKVRLVNVSGGRAIARSGYYESGSDSAAERTLSNAEIIINDIPTDAVHVASLAAPFATSGVNAQVPVILEIRGSDLAVASDQTVKLEIFIYAFDADGIARDSMYQRVALDLGRVGAALRASGVKYYATLSLPPGKYAVKSLVRVAEGDRKGYTRSDIVVPAKGEIAVSQPLFQDQGVAWMMIKGPSHDKTNAPYPFELNGASFVPSATVRVIDGEPRRFVVFIGNAAPDELSVETKPEARLITQLRSDSGSKFVFELGGKPATSVLNVAVHKHGEARATVSSMTLQ